MSIPHTKPVIPCGKTSRPEPGKEGTVADPARHATGAKANGGRNSELQKNVYASPDRSSLETPEQDRSPKRANCQVE